MDIFNNIIHYFKNKSDTDEGSSLTGTCPVCWGYQEYDKKIKEVIEDKQIDINNHKDSYMIIQEFMKHHIDGVKLKEGKVTNCPSCSTDNLR
ncbi:hypothetical protein ES731_05970 [Psychroflexus gondwanensis]|jgi:hypothetical protein|uniref:hypothetical protein n=1 Tax=Psychroflexus gondwanensis TaxID=251 RepID=UPI0011BD8536|nr:hypothetical protein [Psychroflexus gondwanensis]TXE20559.1 hypothetical protein ES731_05970 [Psychroflexus gondwanensis]